MINFSDPTRPKAQIPDPYLVELYALCRSSPKGNFAEIGVYKGGSAWVFDQVAKSREGCTLHLFDTFKGIPTWSAIDTIAKGAFADVNVEDVRRALPNAVFHIGVFPATLTDEVSKLAFVHVDCDQYDTCKAVIDSLWPRMVEGGIMVFDDYPFQGIKKAIHDAFSKVNFTPRKIPYVIKGDS